VVEQRAPGRPDSPTYKPKGFTSYDIWCAGTSRKTFPIISADEDAYQRLLNRTRFLGQEYAVNGIHKVEYPDGVEKNKSALLRNFNPLVEKGDEHQSFCKEDPEEQGHIGNSPDKGKEKQGG